MTRDVQRNMWHRCETQKKKKKKVKLRVPHLLHVLSNRILLQELGAFPRVKPFGVGQELCLKVFLVDRQSRTFSEGVVLIETQLHCERQKEP